MTRLHFLFVAVLCLLFTTVLVAEDQCVPDVCGGGLPCEVEFYGGQDIDVGDVTLSQDEGWLSVLVDTDGGWKFDQLHVYVGTEPVPTNGAGNPRPGHFPHTVDYDELMTRDLVMVPLSSMGIDTAAEDCAPLPLYVVVHAELINVLNDQEETGFAYGDMEFPGRRWGWSICFGVECDAAVEEPPADCDYWTQTGADFESCCLANPDDADCYGPVQ